MVYCLDKVNFTTPFGDQVSFDVNGNALPLNNIMNCLWLSHGTTKIQNVRGVRESAKGEELTLDGDRILRNFESKQVPSAYGFHWVSCGTWCRTGCPLIGRSVAWSRAPPVCMCKFLGQNTEPQIAPSVCMNEWMVCSVKCFEWSDLKFSGTLNPNRLLLLMVFIYFCPMMTQITAWNDVEQW